MIWTVVWYLSLAVLALFAYLTYFVIVVPLRQRAYYKKLGVVFGKGTPFITEITRLKQLIAEDPYQPVLSRVATQLGMEALDTNVVPRLTGLCMPNRNLLFINSVDFLNDIYVKYNAFHTKSDQEQNIFAILGGRNIVFMDTHDKAYPPTRKSLSAAFFKSKLQALTKIIKEVTLR